jgi:hypothetical protein
LRKSIAAAAKPAGKEGAEGEGQAEHVGAGDARHDRMRQRVADQRPALQHQVGRQEGADAADEGGDPHGVDHVAVGEGFGERRDHASSSFLSGASVARVVAVAVDDERPLVVGEHRDAARVVVVVQVGAAEDELPQHAAEGLFQVGVGEDLGGRAFREHGAVDQHGAVAEAWHAAQIVRRDEHDAALVAQRPEQRDDRLLGAHVDAGERLVEQDDLALLGQRAGEEDALLLAAGKLADLALAVVGHADPLQRSVDRGAVGGLRHAHQVHVAVAAHHDDVLDEDREIPVDLLGLRHVGDERCASAPRRPAGRRSRRCRRRAGRSP